VFCLFVVCMVFSSCQKKYACNDLEQKNGFFYEKNTGVLANGQFECFEDRDANGIIHSMYISYEQGRRSGEWLRLINKDTVHHGKIYRNPAIERSVSQQYNAKYVEMEIWYEDGRRFFDLSIMIPENKLDSSQVQRIVNSDLSPFMKERKLHRVTMVLYDKQGDWTAESYMLTE
jgi:hypothetical protein